MPEPELKTNDTNDDFTENIIRHGGFLGQKHICGESRHNLNG